MLIFDVKRPAQSPCRGFHYRRIGLAGYLNRTRGPRRTPSVPGHELSGVVVELGYGTTGLTHGQRVFGLADWACDGSLAGYTAVEARNLVPLPTDFDHTAAALPISGLTAWQGVIRPRPPYDGTDRPDPRRGGAVGSIAVQLAGEAGARVIGTGRSTSREQALSRR
jgi:NADPH:quinone reductase-like Zn-dependent oxidoreductase